ncbi:uncharacterized protein LOC134205369 isoform X2 [Armigeres subalbatus]|uniref:uncharacterized protein LOC134205369 isoform X2 n=1 Tax=Armigeres subalbatus TaxID=124917 RepID=UPI002ED5CEB3
MVIGEATNNGEAVPPPQQFAPQKATIENIMSGIENTGTVKMNNHRKKLRQRFDIIKKLGQGTYGKVQLGINKETGQEVAIKTIKKSKIETEADLIRIRREVQIMSSVQHPNIIHIYEVFENREKMVLVMEFAAGGELYDYLSERKVLSEEEARRIFRQVATAIYYCHKHKICHRDLKLENILLDENGHAKIADFGLSNVFDEQRLLATFCGSPLYASPEIVKGTPYLGPEVDCWSLGVLLYTLVYGAMPFDGANFKRLVKQISQGDYFEPKKPSRASPLIREMLTVCPQRRANIEQICNHWWVNEGYEGSCLDLAEELANQTPVRLDVLLSLAPPSVTSDQVVVGSGQDDAKPKERIQRSHSVGSIIDIGATEAERRILDMVAAGGEAALMPSPTRTITPSESSPAQPKRKLEPTVSTENATGAVKKKEKASDRLKPDKSQPVIPEDMDVELSPSRPSSTSEIETLKSGVETPDQESTPSTPIAAQDVLEDLQNLENMCDELLQETATPPTSKATTPEDTPTAVNDAQPATPPTPKVESPPKTVSGVKARLEKLEKADKQPEKVPYKKVFSKNKTVDLTSAINQVSKQDQEFAQVKSASNLERKNSLPEENLAKPAERRKSRILETAEKFQNMNNQNNDKFKKFSLPGTPTVGNYKKEFERKASMNNSASSFRPSPYEMTKMMESELNSPDQSRQSSGADLRTPLSPSDEKIGTRDAKLESEEVKESDSKSSVSSFSLEEARRSMENSIALLSKVRPEANAVDQLCAKTETVSVSDNNEREQKLKNAREIIGNAIPIGRLRKPPMPFGANGRSSTGGIGLTNSQSSKQFRFGPDTPEPKFDTMSVPRKVSAGNISSAPMDETKTSHAEITLKSATLPRRKIGKVDIHGETQPKAESSIPAAQPSSMRFSTEMQHQIPDLRSAPIREHPISFTVHQRANSLEPQVKEHTIAIQRPPTYQRTTSNAFGSSRGSLSRQSTNESNDSDTTASQSQIPPLPNSGSTMPIKKSPREFIIPIAVEGGGFIQPRANSLEPSESSTTTTSTGLGSRARLGRTRKIGSLLSEKDPEEESSFSRLNRHTSLGRESDSEEPRFHTMHRLRSSRPSQRSTVEPNDSASSGEEDDDDGFEILTAENLFSTLLSRVRALTNRLNVNEPSSTGFPSSRFMSGLRQTQPSFWHHHDPFSSRLNGGNSNAWRHSMTRDLSSDIDSLFSRSGATLPRGAKYRSQYNNNNNFDVAHNKSDGLSRNNNSNNNNLSSVIPSSFRNSSSSRNDLYQNSYGISNNSNMINNNCSNFDKQSNTETLYENGEEVLDLGDLDLSQLRLSKKDLEALSSITPSLSQRVQEQLFAQLPPQQAKKLSRTLSMQNGNTMSNPYSTTTKLYKRSSSSSAGRTEEDSRDSITPTNDMFDSDAYLQKRSSKKLDRSSRSSSNSRDIVSPPPLPPPNFIDDYGTSSSSRFPYANESHERIRSYEKYTPYGTNAQTDSEHERSKSLEYDKKFSCYEPLPPRTSCLSPTTEGYGRPPIGCISPPPISASSGYSSQRSTRRISRFLRPDFFDPPKESSDQEKLKKEQETQNILREIREKSRERSIDCSFTPEYSDKGSDRLNYFIQKYHKDHTTENSRHNSNERNEVLDQSRDINEQRNRRSLSRPREIIDSSNVVLDKITENTTFADKIIDELQNMAAIQTVLNATQEVAPRRSKSRELIADSVALPEIIKRATPERSSTTNCSECSVSPPKLENEDSSITESIPVADEPVTDPITTPKVVKIKKVKTRPKLDADGNPVTITVRRVRRVNKATGEVISTTLVDDVRDDDKTPTEKTRVVKKESKLIRPKSYPSKDPEPQSSTKPLVNDSGPSDLAIAIPSNESDPSACSTPSNTVSVVAPVSKIARPKSFPSSKLTPPKEIKLGKNSIEAQPLRAISENPEPSKDYSSSQVASKEKTPPKAATVNGSVTNESTTPATTPGTTKKVRKVIRIVKKSTVSKSDSSTKSSSEEKAIKEPTITKTIAAESKETKEVKVKRVEIVSPEPIQKVPKEKSKSPEKKVKQGFLASIGQKFEKFRESSKMTKEKKPTISEDKDNVLAKNVSQEDADPTVETNNKEKKKSRSVTNAAYLPDDAPVSEEKSSRKSRIDKVIRNLRELSVPRAPLLTESNLVKRAVSVEEMPGTFNKCSVNKSSSHISTMDTADTLSALESVIAKRDSLMTSVEEQTKERPKSGSFVSKIQKPYIGARSDTVLTMTEQECKSNTMVPVKQNGGYQTNIPVKYNCPDCNKEDFNKDVSKRHSSALTDAKNHSQIEKERTRNSRRALTLDFGKLGESRHVQSNNNNYSYPPPLPSDVLQNSNHVTTTNNNNTMNMNMLTPSYDSITNYSSGSRSSPYDDCNSSSTFMSPSEEHELYFDNWSVCSDDHNNTLSASPSVSRLSRLTYVNSVSPVDNDSESVIERIRRKSFYTRFNEQKPRRVSTILAPSSSKEYYRDQSLSRGGPSSTRLKEYGKSSSSSVGSALTSVERSKNNYDYYHSLTRTPSSSKNKYADSTDEYSKSSLNNSDYYHHHHHHHHCHLPLSNSSRKLNFSSNDSSDNLNYNTVGKSSLRSTYYETSSPPYYATYNPRRRSSFTSNSTTANLTSSSSSIALDTANTGKETRDTVQKTASMVTPAGLPCSGTATNSSSSTTISTSAGLPSHGSSSSRKLRPYDNRSISMLNSASFKESRHGGYDSAGIIRNGRFRNSSIPRNPTNNV